ncbi:MAG: hypothetical protein IJR90_00190 [Clostridia bacterium]|nr:hypothetical protein [Clostridia bacterium]
MFGVICFICGMMLGGSAAFLLFCVVSSSASGSEPRSGGVRDKAPSAKDKKD